jgi:hypothetical protein
MAAQPPSRLHELELLLSRRRPAVPRRWHFKALLIMCSIEILCDTCAPEGMFLALTFFSFPDSAPQGSANIMKTAYNWMLVNLVLHTMSRLGCCVLTSVHLTQGRFRTIEKQV